jgi:hypothetical protein
VEKQENPSTGSLVDPLGQTDGQAAKHDEVNSSFLQFCERI